MMADLYLAVGRADDAIAVLTEVFQRRFDTVSYRMLLETAALARREDAVRTSALALARASADTRGGAQLVLLLLSDNDLVGAWESPDSLSVGSAWRELAGASEDEFPRRSADLYRPALADALRVANTKWRWAPSTYPADMSPREADAEPVAPSAYPADVSQRGR